MPRTICVYATETGIGKRSGGGIKCLMTYNDLMIIAFIGVNTVQL